MLKNIFATATVALVLSAAAAQATPITTPPPTLIALGDVIAVYVFADASDSSILNEVTPSSITQIFCNHPIGPCPAGFAGQQDDLGVQSGAMVFSLNNTTRSTTFTTNATASDGDYHALISSNYAVYNEGALPAAAATVITNLQNQGKAITYVGFEDAINGDYDYNDLIFAFAGTTSTPTSGVPEPLTISLFGAGVAAAGFFYRRRRQAKAG